VNTCSREVGCPPESVAFPSPAGSYCRLSALAADYDPVSPANQLRLNHDAAARNGECILPEFEFEDVASAHKDAKRPGFDRAIRALLDGRIKTLYVAKLDRLARRGTGHVGLLLDRLEEVGGRIVFVGDDLDSSRPGAREIIAILAEQARAESDAIKWRMEQWHAANRREGLWRKKRPFGYRVVDGKLQPDPREAATVRRIVAEFLAGASLRNIATRLNRDGIDCPNAVKHDEAKAAGRRVRPLPTRRWSYITVRAILCAPSLAALISHEGQLVYDDNGDPIFAGTGIVTLNERVHILREFERRGLTIRNARDPERAGKGRPPKYLLTGFVHCSLCTAAMARHVGRRGRDRAAVYRCSRHGRGHQSPGVSIYAEDIEHEVVRRLTAKLAALEPGDPLLQRIAEQRDAARDGLADIGPPPILDLALLKRELRSDEWEHLPLRRQRELLGLAIRRVYVLPSEGRGWHATPAEDRVHPVWLDELDPFARAT
jgi:site-specific DNA recombinase